MLLLMGISDWAKEGKIIFNWAMCQKNDISGAKIINHVLRTRPEGMALSGCFEFCSIYVRQNMLDVAKD